MLLLPFLAAVPAIGVCPAAAASLDLNLSDEAVWLGYTGAVGAAALEWSIGALHHKDSGDVAALGLHVSGSPATSVSAGIGGKLFYVDEEDLDGGALGIGGFVRFGLAGEDRLGFGGHAYYAPEVTSYSGLEEYGELGVRVDYRILDQAAVYVGYREVQAEFEEVPDSVTIDSGLHFGFELTF